MSSYLTFDIGGTKIKYGLVDETGVIIDAHIMETEAHLGGLHIIHKVGKVIEAYIAKQDIAGIGVSTAGVVDSKSGTIIYANDNIPNYTGMNIKKLIEERFDIPCEVENDVACAGLSEMYYGAAKNKHISICLTIGTGIGGCILIDNQVFHGSSYYAGEVGYMKINGSRFEDLASTRALIQNVKKEMQIADINGERIFGLAQNGEEKCQIAIDMMCDYMAQGIANICYVINPDVVVVGGGITAQGKYLYDILNEKLDLHLLETVRKKTELVFAENGNHAGMLGAYCNFCIQQSIPCGEK